MHYLELLFAFLPVILAGILNMAFIKLPVLNFLKTPIDLKFNFIDGKRLFGDNKTWKGFIGMLIFGALLMYIQSYLSMNYPVFKEITLIDFNLNNPWLAGAWLGFGYAVAELPNSFIKRRIGIAPGKNSFSGWGWFNMLIDQGDSVVGCIVVFHLVILPLTFADMLTIFIIGTGLHYIINVVLYFAGLKKQAG